VIWWSHHSPRRSYVDAKSRWIRCQIHLLLASMPKTHQRKDVTQMKGRCKNVILHRISTRCFVEKILSKWPMEWCCPLWLTTDAENPQRTGLKLKSAMGKTVPSTMSSDGVSGGNPGDPPTVDHPQESTNDEICMCNWSKCQQLWQEILEKLPTEHLWCKPAYQVQSHGDSNKKVALRYSIIHHLSFFWG